MGSGTHWDSLRVKWENYREVTGAYWHMLVVTGTDWSLLARRAHPRWAGAGAGAGQLSPEAPPPTAVPADGRGDRDGAGWTVRGSPSVPKCPQVFPVSPNVSLFPPAPSSCWGPTLGWRKSRPHPAVPPPPPATPCWTSWTPCAPSAAPSDPAGHWETLGPWWE